MRAGRRHLWPRCQKNRPRCQIWPTIYLIDKKSHIRHRWEGELEFDNQDGTHKIAQLVENLLSE
jgi:hypothetical protein